MRVQQPVDVGQGAEFLFDIAVGRLQDLYGVGDDPEADVVRHVGGSRAIAGGESDANGVGDALSGGP